MCVFWNYQHHNNNNLIFSYSFNKFELVPLTYKIVCFRNKNNQLYKTYLINNVFENTVKLKKIEHPSNFCNLFFLLWLINYFFLNYNKIIILGTIWWESEEIRNHLTGSRVSISDLLNAIWQTPTPLISHVSFSLQLI